MNSDSPPTRAYRQGARARAAEDTGHRIIDAFLARFEAGWFDEVRLEDVAADAGVTVQTVIRRFGGKDGLLEAAADRMDAQILGDRALPVGDIGTALDTIVAEYETRGELIIRILAQEDRYAPIRVLADHGRATHRAWVGAVFAPWLEELPAAERESAHDGLVIALDVYVWKLVRADMRRSPARLRRTMLDLCASALGLDPDGLERVRIPSPETIDD